MSVEARKAALERRHAAIEVELQSLSTRPSPDAAMTSQLKREKLRLKDELARLSG
ncbi:YdcH family protein [Acuticoccus sp.]|uniref:YdcH family protein n=1 Tax=Acuticoccus sp. TaxID=1904378 RepID=UPI003B5178E7